MKLIGDSCLSLWGLELVKVWKASVGTQAVMEGRLRKDS